MKATQQETEEKYWKEKKKTKDEKKSNNNKNYFFTFTFLYKKDTFCQKKYLEKTQFVLLHLPYSSFCVAGYWDWSNKTPTPAQVCIGFAETIF